MTSIAIIQPNFIPWRGYFDVIHDVDHFVLLDDVLYTRRDWRNRNRLCGAGGKSGWMTVPVLHRSGQTIREVRIDNSRGWRRKHLGSLRHRYAKAPHFDAVHEMMSRAYDRPFTHLWQLNDHLIREIAARLGITTPISRVPDIGKGQGRNERLIAIARHFGADTYLSGPAAGAYIDPALWAAAGIALCYKDYGGYPRYRQISGGFDPHLSIIDLMMMTGPDAAAHIWGHRGSA